MLRVKYFFHKIFNWEYWHQWVVYAPIIVVYLYYAARAKAIYFINAANPTMENGGYIMESKYTIYNQLPKHLQPSTILINTDKPLCNIEQLLYDYGIPFPCIAKPDIGGKGVGVKVIHNAQQLLQYHKNIVGNYLVQQKINYTKEVGIFYCRMPNESEGKITGIVSKKPMKVLGNGINTLEELINNNPRFYYQKKVLHKELFAKWNTVLKSNETLILSCIGNHARGSEFRDITYLENEQLLYLIDSISKQYNTFYFGRYDIMYNNWDDLCQGKNFSIIELNGSGSEPTHIYDPHHSIFKAWKIILQHWKYLYSIASYNHQQGVPYFTFKQGRLMIKKYARLTSKMASINNFL